MGAISLLSLLEDMYMSSERHLVGDVDEDALHGPRGHVARVPGIGELIEDGLLDVHLRVRVAVDRQHQEQLVRDARHLGVHEPHLDPGNNGEALVLGVDGHLVPPGRLVPLHGLPGGRDGRDADLLVLLEWLAECEGPLSDSREVKTSGSASTPLS